MSIQIGADQIPPGTRAVMVTLEHENSENEPSGPTILYGEDPQML